MASIEQVHALETLDSRGNPTVTAFVRLNDGSQGVASVPSGASTGTREALELRDKDAKRFLGKGVQKAVGAVNQVIAPALKGMDPADQTAIDQAMLKLDGTADKSKLGANAILGVSLAAARAAAISKKQPLFQHIQSLYRHKGELTLPVPMMNVINGGEHADNGLNFQEFMIQPFGFDRFADALRAGTEVFHTLKTLLHEQGLNTAVGDEGGFAPNIEGVEQALELLVQAIKKAGYDPVSQISIALDPAASEFYKDGMYQVEKSKPALDSKGVIEFLSDLAKRYNIRSIEDGLAEQDWDGWVLKNKSELGQIQLVGDDIFVTNPSIFKQGIEKGVGNAILIKLNQIGTLSETLECIAMAKDHGYNAVISHRSGETADTFIADLAVGTFAGQIKTGSLCRSDRVEKYNRLLTIADEFDLPYAKVAKICR